MLDAIAPAIGFGLVAGLMPGPLQTFLLLQTLRCGAPIATVSSPTAS